VLQLSAAAAANANVRQLRELLYAYKVKEHGLMLKLGERGEPLALHNVRQLQELLYAYKVR
jgi:hypothetical protein